ncbi:hypothetical protein A5641_10395 [Mycobacterium sp. 1554424.7]|nr:hypothetical protein A5641_10395 [Mycobacterium sp. 1554424.7]
MSHRESLLDTFAGRLFIDHLRFFHRFSELSPTAFVAGMSRKDLIRAATIGATSYLYWGGCAEALYLDVTEPVVREFDIAGLAALAKLSTFGSPQIHQGTVTELHEPTIDNRDPLSALPNGAFWTSSPVDEADDSWTLCGENLKQGSPRWEVHFDVTRVRVARVDSARDWMHLIDANTITAHSCKYPNWPAIAQSWDAIHLSPTGLLLAHPTISTTPFTTTDGSGHAHSRSGPYASVGDWSAVSTAWLHKPPDARLSPAGAST